MLETGSYSAALANLELIEFHLHLASHVPRSKARGNTSGCILKNENILIYSRRDLKVACVRVEGIVLPI